MPKPEQIHIQRHMSDEELERKIKTEKDARILKRLYFIKYRYERESVKVASQRVGITRNEGYIWQKRWNEKGYIGLIPRFAGGKPPKLSDEQKERLKIILKERDKKNWTTEEVRELIFREFVVEYTPKQIRIILKKFKMNHAKPYPHDYRRPKDAEEILKKLTRTE
jgi:putative transposase